VTAPQQVSATAFVSTPRPQRYIKQLVSHFGNKVSTQITDQGGSLEFDFGICDLRAVPEGIELVGTAADEAQLETLKDVVARHLLRFGTNDELAVSWTS
jgi:caffeoyl-CoA O-methyltransferase